MSSSSISASSVGNSPPASGQISPSPSGQSRAASVQSSPFSDQSASAPVQLFSLPDQLISASFQLSPFSEQSTSASGQLTPSLPDPRKKRTRISLEDDSRVVEDEDLRFLEKSSFSFCNLLVVGTKDGVKMMNWLWIHW